jgi:hypothetical protein
MTNLLAKTDQQSISLCDVPFHDLEKMIAIKQDGPWIFTGA